MKFEVNYIKDLGLKNPPRKNLKQRKITIEHKLLYS